MSDPARDVTRPGSPPPADDAAAVEAARRRRMRLWLTLASISIGWKVLVFTLGAALPRWFIDDGLAALPVEARGYGAEARQTALGLWNGRIERLGFVRSVRVMSVDTLPTDQHAGCAGPPLGARVRAYTYFAIPYSEVRTRCESGVVEYRVFRRRAQRQPK